MNFVQFCSFSLQYSSRNYFAKLSHLSICGHREKTKLKEVRNSGSNLHLD